MTRLLCPVVIVTVVLGDLAAGEVDIHAEEKKNQANKPYVR